MESWRYLFFYSFKRQHWSSK